MNDRRSRRLYRWLLRLAPSRLREQHADEMTDLFIEALVEARARGRARACSAWCRASADLIAARLASWIGTRPRSLALHAEGRGTMFGSDARYAIRSLGSQKLATLLVLGMLALGIAANVAVFSLVNGLFLRPFPFPNPDRLVYFNETAPKWNLDIVGINYPDFDQWRRGVKLFDGIALYNEQAFNVSGQSGAERVTGARVTHEFARVLGIAPIVGRTFTPEEDRPNGPPVVVIGYGIWKDRFSCDPHVVGRTLRLDGVAHTIVGVLPAEAEFPGEVRLWVPFAGDPHQTEQSYFAEGIGRLKPGVTAAQAERDVIRAHQPVWEARDQERVVSPFVRPLRDQFVKDFRNAASTLLGAVAILLVVACANVASVMLARALARRREMGIRLALGAARLHLVRQLLVENVILALVGGALGLALGHSAVRMLVRTLPDALPTWASFGIDARVVVFSVAASLITVVLFGWAPAFHATRGDLRSAVHDSSNGTTASPRGRRTLWFLVSAEFAMAALLLVCGGLLLKAFDRVRHVEPGFRTDRVLTFALSLPDATYATAAQRIQFWDALRERLGRLPGVHSAGLITCLPLGCHWGTFYVVEGETRNPGDHRPVTLYRLASPDYFKTMDVRLLDGRLFDEHDGRDHRNVVIVNETFARTFWPDGRSPVGRRIKNPGEESPWLTVVGLVRDVRHYGLERPMRPGIYQPLPADASATLSVALHTSVAPESATPAARAALRELDPDLPLFRVQTIETAMRRSLRTRTTISWLLGIFAAMALVLALGGSYGVVSYLATQRAREIGIRTALGARNRDIVLAVVGRGIVSVSAGILIGIVSSMAASRLMAEMLFGVPAGDRAVLSSVAIALLATAAAGSWLPARRAARVQPLKALRTE
jgi:putative ABC transport system permease protein